MHERAAALAFAALAVLACGNGPSGPSPAERAVAEKLGAVLRLDIDSVTCRPAAEASVAERSAAATIDACTVRARGHEPFQVEVHEAEDAGERRLRPEGHRNIEYQLALGLLERVRALPESVSCPRDGDVRRGFSCQITLPGGIAARVDVAAAGGPDHFVWTAPELLTPAVIEERIAGSVRDQGRDARVDCGDTVRLSVPGTAFECAIAFSGGGAATAAVTVMDRDGHVSYRVIDAAPAPDGQ